MCLTVMAETATLFPYPIPPESLPIGRQRANYMIEHFWDRCPWKMAYTDPAKMESTLRDFADMLPLAAPDTVHASIEHLIKQTQKKPADFATLMRLAEAVFNSDSAAIMSDEVYLPFVEAAAGYKKFKSDERDVYARKAQVMRSSSMGATLPPLTASLRNGEAYALNDTTSGAQTYVLIFETPGNAAARFDRVRFAANIAARRLIDAGLVKPLLIATTKANDDWWKSTDGLPEQWIVAEMPQAADYFDLRVNPAIYMLNGNMEVVSKWMPMSSLIANCEQLMRIIDSQE